MGKLINFLALLGICTVFIIAVFVIILIAYGIKEGICECKRVYTYKHRFDKPPTAKCYCKDCKSWRESDGKCFIFEGWYTADRWFCWNADPK